MNIRRKHYYSVLYHVLYEPITTRIRAYTVISRACDSFTDFPPVRGREQNPFFGQNLFGRVLRNCIRGYSYGENTIGTWCSQPHVEAAVELNSSRWT